MNEGYHPGGLDIDQCQHPINRMGEAQTAFWVLGNPAEGANFYTYVLPRPLVNSRFWLMQAVVSQICIIK